MDYANGAHLAKWQWDLIHDPAMLVNIFEGDEKSAYREKLAYACLPVHLMKVSAEEYYYNLAGKGILLNSNYEPYAFVGISDSHHNQVGALAIIKRKADGKLSFPAKNDQAYPDYYAIKSGTKNEIDDKVLLKFAETHAGKATLVTINNADCSYTIERAGAAGLPGKLERGQCACFKKGNRNGSTDSGGLSQVIDKTGENLDLSSLKDLLDGKLSLVDPKMGTLQAKVAYVYLTSETNTAALEEVSKAQVPDGILKIWLHKNSAG